MASRLRSIHEATRPKMHGRAMISGPSGSGKALRDDQPVLTPTGWVPIGYLEPGDLVFGVDGVPTTVSGVYPQGVRELFEVEFSDGVVVVADGDHLWVTQTVNERAVGAPGGTRTTEEIAATLRMKSGRAFHYVPMPGPVLHPTADLPVDPYVLGVLLGDGGMSGRGVVLSNPDDEIVEEVRKHFDLTLHKGSTIDFQVLGAPQLLRPLGLMGKRSDEKFVPDEYLFADPEQRLALLQGLLDTDGYANGYTCEFSTSSPDLCEALVHLVRSFGGTVTVSERTPTFTYRGEKRTGRPSYRCYVKLPGNVEPFRLSRKKEAYTPRTKYQPWRQIVDVRQVEDGAATCISVDAPDRMFLTAGCVPTHNTWTSLSIATYLVAFEHFLAAGGDPTNVEPGDVDISTVEASEILVIDTEKESSLTYADVFRFSHLPWRPPFDPAELRDTLEELDRDPPVVTIIDSFSKFWHGQGGILDIAGGAIGGWKTARPLQEALVEQLLATSTHLILGVRSKMEYLIEGGRGNQTVQKLGLNPMQDDNLVYEMNVAADIDMEHRITVTKSRTPAVPVGRMYPAGLERKMAEDYADWLAGGVPPANRQDVEAIVERFAAIVSKDRKIQVKTQFVERFGMPHSLTADRVAAANQWLDEALSELDEHGDPTTQDDPEPTTTQDDPEPPVDDPELPIEDDS